MGVDCGGWNALRVVRVALTHACAIMEWLRGQENCGIKDSQTGTELSLRGGGGGGVHQSPVRDVSETDWANHTSR